MEYVYEKLEELCFEKMQKKGLEKFEVRLRQELGEIKLQKEYEYVLKLYDKGIKADKNEHNLLVYYLLDISNDINLDKSPSYTEPQYPDE